MDDSAYLKQILPFFQNHCPRCTTTYLSHQRKNSFFSVATQADGIGAQCMMCSLKVLMLCMYRQEFICVMLVVAVKHSMTHFMSSKWLSLTYSALDLCLDSGSFDPFSLHCLHKKFTHSQFHTDPVSTKIESIVCSLAALTIQYLYFKKTHPTKHLFFPLYFTSTLV